MKGVVLSGGTGSRLRPITHTGPKQLVPVGNKPVIEYVIDDLREAGIEEIGVVLGNKGRDAIQSLLGDGTDYGVDITYIVQGNPLGLAHAVGCAREFVGDDNFVVYLGDNILKQGITDFVERFTNSDCAAGIALQEVDTPEQFGIVDTDANGAVTRLVEKPDEPPTNLALIGIYVFSPVIFDVIETLTPSWRGELEITEAIQKLLERGHAVDAHRIQGWWKDTGKPEDILEANRLVLEDNDRSLAGTVDSGADVTGRVDLAETAHIEDGAVVRGPVSIAADATVANGAYVGPYTSIGECCVVENTHVENSVVMGHSTITTTSTIVDSLVGRETTVDNTDDLLPDGHRLVVGENSSLNL